MDSGPHFKSYTALGSLGTAVPETYEQDCIKKTSVFVMLEVDVLFFGSACRFGLGLEVWELVY